MAYTLRRTRAHCWSCKRRDVPLYLLHTGNGAACGVLCGEHASEYLPVAGTTASPLGNKCSRPPAAASFLRARPPVA
jgi:hypothetical protein